MTEAASELIPKHGSSTRFYKALGVSVLVHLSLLMLVPPARWQGPSEVVIQARLEPVRVLTQAAVVDEPVLPESAPEQASPEVVPLEAAQPDETAPQTVAVPPDTPVSTSSGEPRVEIAARDAAGRDEESDTAVYPTSSGEPRVEIAARDTAGRDEESDTAVYPTSSGEPRVEIAARDTAERDEESNLPIPEVPLLVDTRWYTAREVERRPEPLGEILPVYPEEARRRGIEGSVVLALHIDETGAVQEVEILRSSPPGVFDAAVVAAYGQARFRPAIRAGRPVRYIGRYRVLFELQ